MAPPADQSVDAATGGGELRHTVTIAHALFTHGPRRKIALRGAQIEISQADYERGLADGAFVADGSALVRHGELPKFDYEPDDVAEIASWMRSATLEEIVAELDRVRDPEDERDIEDVLQLMLAGELMRGSEARSDVYQLLVDGTVVPPMDSPLDEEPADATEGEDKSTPAEESEEDEILPAETKPEAGANIQAIVAWVGSDADRAAEFIELEEARDKPRTSLLEQLEKVLEG